MRPRNAYCSFCRKSHQDVGPLVEGPGEVYICSDCVQLCQEIIEQERRRRNPSARPGSAALQPEVVRARLDQLVIGQEEAKDALALAAGRRHVSARHVLLIGPSLSCKLFLARALAHVLEAPFTAGDSSGLVESTYGAVDVVHLLYSLLCASDFDMEAAQHGVVYLDDVDGQEAQEALLRLWQAEVGNVRGHIQLDIRRVLFVCGGTFAGLREATDSSGRPPEQSITAEALVALGARPEWVRHLAAIARAAPFDEETLGRLVAWVGFPRLDSGPD